MRQPHLTPESLILSSLILLCLITGCAKDAGNPSDNDNGNGNWKPPTSVYYKIDNVSNTASMDAVQCSQNGGNVSLVKRFENLSGATGQLRVTFKEAPPSPTGYRNIDAEISEGTWKSYAISPNLICRAVDSVNVEVDFEFGGEYYYLKGTSGKVIVSKSSGKLRYTTDGVIVVTGPKYAAPGFVGSFSRNLEFSIECGAQF